eukprot:m.1218353 g.1218353  ORF g.1218353 m.1218353 type:complete len:309 (-) comp24619_c0_seq12:3606-4532(-)
MHVSLGDNVLHRGGNLNAKVHGFNRAQLHCLRVAHPENAMHITVFLVLQDSQPRSLLQRHTIQLQDVGVAQFHHHFRLFQELFLLLCVQFPRPFTTTGVFFLQNFHRTAIRHPQAFFVCRKDSFRQVNLSEIALPNHFCSLECAAADLVGEECFRGVLARGRRHKWICDSLWMARDHETESLLQARNVVRGARIHFNEHRTVKRFFVAVCKYHFITRAGTGLPHTPLALTSTLRLHGALRPLDEPHDGLCRVVVHVAPLDVAGKMFQPHLYDPVSYSAVTHQHIARQQLTARWNQHTSSSDLTNNDGT